MFARAQIFYFHLRPFIAEQDRDAGAELLGGLELFADLRGTQRIIDAITAVPQGLELGERVGAALENARCACQSAAFISPRNDGSAVIFYLEPGSN